jgi:NADPH:quinone reductase-like Zn-dependent oxidoreductase
MRAVRFDEYGDYDVLKVVDIPRPTPGEGQVLVKVLAAAVNPFDNTCRRGWVEQVKPPMIQGNEGVGEVVEGTDALPTGTRVFLMGTFGFARDGTWQDYLVATPDEAVAAPANLSDVEAAAAPIAYVAAELALKHGVKLTPEMTVLIPGVGGSVGNAALQLARIHGAARLISTAGRSDKAEQGRAAGFEVVDRSTEDLPARVMEMTDGKGVDVVLDSIGGEVTGQALKCLAPGGRLIQMGYPAGTDLTVDSITLIWSPLGHTAPVSIHGFNIYFQPPEAYADAWATVLPLLGDGRVKPAIGATYPLERAGEATRHLVEDRPFGKVVLTM